MPQIGFTSSRPPLRLRLFRIDNIRRKDRNDDNNCQSDREEVFRNPHNNVARSLQVASKIFATSAHKAGLGA